MGMSTGRLLETSSGRPQGVILPSVLRLMLTSFKNLKEAPTLSSLIIYFQNIFTNFRQIILQSVKNWMQNCFRKGFFVEIFRQIKQDKLYDLSCFFTTHVHLLFTNILFITVLLISFLPHFFMLAFRMFLFCYYNIVKIRSASRLPLFLTIFYNRKWVFKVGLSPSKKKFFLLALMKADEKWWKMLFILS